MIEGDKINTHVTAPSAVMALALMYMKSNDREVAARLQVPDTIFLLEQVRPDVLLLRTTAKCLVLWDSIEPTEKWLHTQVPLVIRPTIAVLEQGGTTALLQDDPLFDTSRQSFINIWTGACFAMGLRFAGSADGSAAAVLRQQLLWFMKLQKQQANKGDRMMMENCISTLALSYAMVMAGTGDVEALRVLRKLRKRVGHEVTYGHHMAIGMAIGLLFLGAGRHSLSTSNKAIAALLIAFFPSYPATTLDNRYHMQAYRHMYVLAVEERVFTTREVDTLALCSLPVDIYLQIPTPVPLSAPLPSRGEAVSPGLDRSGTNMQPASVRDMLIPPVCPLILAHKKLRCFCTEFIITIAHGREKD
jgi:anaphase-promoting complex subunit 1